MLRSLLIACLVTAFAGCASLENADFPSKPATADAVARTRVATASFGASAAFSSALGSDTPFREPLAKVDKWLESGTPPAAANWIGILDSGEAALLARLHLIRHARQSIDLQTFIWTDDEVGHLVAVELMRAAARGVKVRVLVDYLGIAKNAEALAFVARAHPNLEVRVYRPTARTLERGQIETLAYALMNFKGANQRMHHKVLVVDEALAITGGRNVENTYYDLGASMNFKDRDAMVIGPVAAEMAITFDDFWNYRHTVPALDLRDVARAEAAPSLDDEAPSLADRLLKSLADRADRADSVERALIRPLRRAGSVRFVSDLPGKNGAFFLEGGGHLTAHVLDVIGGAEREVWIQSPYLVLGDPGLRFFRKLRRDKPSLEIHISTNSFGSTDNLLAYAGNVRLRDRYVHQLGFQIYEYRPHPADLRRVLPTYDLLLRESQAREKKPGRKPFLCLHGKSFVVDGRTAFIGSFNLDPRSAHLNTEAGLIIEDEAIAAALLEDIRRDLSVANSWVIAPRPALPGLRQLQVLTQGIAELSPVEIKAIDTSAAYELKPGAEPVSRAHPEFYERFRDIGTFPGSDGLLSEKELKTRLFKFSTKSANSLL